VVKGGAIYSGISLGDGKKDDFPKGKGACRGTRTRSSRTSASAVYGVKL
jgi:hypothetical protein